jgi:hypothetical protein
MVEVNSLHTQIRQLIAEMELLSNAPAAKLQSNPGHSKPTSKAPTMDGPALADIWTVRFAQHNDNPLALAPPPARGRAALELRRHGAPSLHDTIESEDFILTAYEGVDAETVALIESERGALCRPAYVIWLRRRNDRNDRGHPAAPSDSRVVVREAPGGGGAEAGKDRAGDGHQPVDGLAAAGDAPAGQGCVGMGGWDGSRGEGSK